MAQIDWNTINKILSSKGTELALGAAGAYLTSRGANQRADQQLALQRQGAAQNAAQFRVNTIADLLRSEEAAQLARAQAAMGSTRLGENSNFATRNRIARALVPQLAAQRLTPADPAVARLMPQMPALNIPPEALAALSDEATAAEIAQRSQLLANIDPDAAMPDFAAMGLPTDRQAMLEQYRQNVASERGASRQHMLDLIQRALDEDLDGEKSRNLPEKVRKECDKHPAYCEAYKQFGPPPKGHDYDKKTGELKKKSSVWKKVGKAAIIGGAALATAASGGAASPALMAAIGAGTGAATGAIDGGWRGALLGAGMGAATGGFGGGPVGSAAGQAGRQAMVSTLRDPRFWMNTVGTGLGGRTGTALTLAGQFSPRLDGRPTLTQEMRRPTLSTISRRRGFA